MATINTVACPADQWTKVSTGIKKGTITPLNVDPTITLYAVVATGGAAPTAITDGEVFKGPLVYDSGESSDVYVWPTNNAGSIRESKEA